MIESPCRLADNAYVCLADGRLVFSDIRHDRYQCLGRVNTQHALHFIDGFPSADIARPHGTDRELTECIVRALTEAGLLADSESSGKPFTPVRIATPTSQLRSAGVTARPRPDHRLSFLRAAVTASAKLRLQRLQRIVRNVERRKRGDSSPQNCDDVRELTAVFHRLRPYYVREYLCRFDSLALLEFLANYRRFPEWVFGVTGEPFAAHCWVQDGDCVLNDTVDYVRRFTPIMAF